MNALFESEQFRSELPGWALRGILCASSSAFWAYMGGFTSPAELVGMVAGITGWVLIFAGVCAGLPRWSGLRLPRLVDALKIAAWVKFGVTALGWFGFAVAAVVHQGAGGGMIVFGMLDMLLGMASLWLVSQAAGFRDFEQIAPQDSFGLTALTTLVDGALFAAVILGITLAVLGWWRFGPRVWQKLKLPPARSVG